MKYFIAIILITILGVFCMFKMDVFGTRPNEDEQKKFTDSSQYNAKEKIFQNRRPDLVKEMRKKAFSLSTFKEWFSKGIDRVPITTLPEVKPNMADFLKPSAEPKVIWFGHSTFLLNLNGSIILVDPVFSGTASPFSFAVKRFQKPVLELSELPEIDYILLSHDHYDHLDMQSIKFFIDKKSHFVTPLGVGSHLKGWGIKSNRITELDWWQNFKINNLEFIATPAQHFSGRDGINDNQTLWASWVLREQNINIYFSGDSGYDTHFKAIGDKYGPFDIAFIENGQYNIKWKEVHVLPEESVQAAIDLKAKKYFPVHWGMFELAFHPWYEPIEKVFALTQEKNVQLVSPKLGQIVTVTDQYNNEAWWKNIIR